LDCGANIGFVSYQFHKRFKDAIVYSFEPNPDVFIKLQSNLMKEDFSIKKFNVGIGSGPDSMVFYKNNNTGTSSFMLPNSFHQAHMARRYSTLEVPIVSIESFCAEHSIDQIGIVKLDIEGFEVEALKGCKNLLKESRIDFLYIEASLVPSYEGQPLIEDVITYMRQFNYIPYNFYGYNETELRESIITNILFMSERIAQEINNKKGKNAVYHSI
jgi:FkbM family methyltransferase